LFYVFSRLFFKIQIFCENSLKLGVLGILQPHLFKEKFGSWSL